MVSIAGVQVDPIELWKTEPFGCIMADGYFKGRGADDDKGGLMTALAVSCGQQVLGPSAQMSWTDKHYVNVAWRLLISV